VLWDLEHCPQSSELYGEFLGPSRPCYPSCRARARVWRVGEGSSCRRGRCAGGIGSRPTTAPEEAAAAASCMFAPPMPVKAAQQEFCARPAHRGGTCHACHLPLVEPARRRSTNAAAKGRSTRWGLIATPHKGDAGQILPTTIAECQCAWLKPCCACCRADNGFAGMQQCRGEACVEARVSQRRGGASRAAPAWRAVRQSALHSRQESTQRPMLY
jgi:hypothetical protein